MSFVSSWRGSSDSSGPRYVSKGPVMTTRHHQSPLPFLSPLSESEECPWVDGGSGGGGKGLYLGLGKSRSLPD